MKRKRALLVGFLLLSCPAAGRGRQAAPAAAPPTHHLMPVPASLELRPGRLLLAGPFTVAVTRHTDARLEGAVDRALRRIEARVGRESARGPVDPAAATLVVECDGPGKTVPALDEDESYTLDISETRADLRAPTVVGAMRGLETLLQLLDGGRDGYFLPCATIRDRPRFPWRGLLLDVGRHFEPIEVIKRNLDGMAAVKLNVLHWHLTEDQGFRVETRKYPELYRKGSDGQYYTQEQVREVIAYARDRGIRVVPEFDLPGHATSWLVAHPELASAPGSYQIERQFGIFEPALDPTKEEVYKLLDGFFGEMAELFPDAYMHIGGDENEGKQWDRNPQIQAFMKAKGIADNHALQAYFNRRLLEILTRHGKKMMGWDEIFHPDLPKSVMIQSWRGFASLAESARQGYDGILSNGYYIDLAYPASQHYLVDPLPAGNGLTPEQAAHILGGEATMWGEYVGPDTIDSRIWPRTAAIAERLWSPAAVSDVADMYRRLAVVSVELEELDLTHERNPAVLLRGLARGGEIGPLETLAAVAEPVKEYRRGEMRPATSLTPLTGFVDAVRPDSGDARRFDAMVDAMLSDAPRFQMYRGAVWGALAEWRDVRPALDVTIDRSPALREVAPLARDLSALGAAGLEAMSYLEAGVAPPPEWLAAKLAVLDEAAKPKAAVELMVVPGVRQLVMAAAELPRLRSMTAGEWRTHVKALASPKPTDEKSSKAAGEGERR